MIGFGKHFIGRAEETEAHVAEALRLSPRDSMAYFWMTYAGIASNSLGRWEHAVSWFRRSIEAVIGYSRLIGEDESGTARSVREHREAARLATVSRESGTKSAVSKKCG
jgi:hypothetical protein